MLSTHLAFGYSKSRSQDVRTIREALVGPVLQDLLTLLDTRHAPVGINLESVPSDFCGLLGSAAHSFFL